MTSPEQPDRKVPPLPHSGPGETRIPETDSPAPERFKHYQAPRPETPHMHWALKILVGIASVIGGGVLLVGVAILVVLGSCMLGR